MTDIPAIVKPGFIPREYDKYGCLDRSSWFSPTPILLHRVLVLDVACQIFTGVFCGSLPADPPGWYVLHLSLAHEAQRALYPVIGLFIPLLLVASYAQWKKVSRGRKVNRVMAFATIFFGLTSIAVSNLCDRDIRRRLSQVDVGRSTGSLACTG